MRRGNSWTETEEAWLEVHYPNTSACELERMHRENFPDRPARSANAIMNRAAKLGLSKDDGYYRSQRVRWTPERVEWLKGYAPGHTSEEIGAEHERVFGVRLNESQISAAKNKFGVKSGVSPTRWGSGHRNSGKGKTLSERGYSEEAQARIRAAGFKKGSIPKNGAVIPIGAERVDERGYIEVKVAERKSHPRCNDNWRKKHYVAYELHNGEIPEGHIVVFADKNKRNFDPENLVAVPNGAMRMIWRRRIPYCDAESLEVAVNITRLMSARNAVARKGKELKCK